MTALPQHHDTAKTDRLTRAAADLGYEIVDIAGFLDMIEEYARSQRDGLQTLKSATVEMGKASKDVQDAVEAMAHSTTDTVQDVESTAALMRGAADKTRSVAGWVTDLATRTSDVSDTLAAVKTNNQQIAAIANQVNTLAINAKIEAARAGDAGRGFAVVAEAINDLSRKTKDAAVQISDNIESLTSWLATLGNEAGSAAKTAAEVLEYSSESDAKLTKMETSVARTDSEAKRISKQSERMQTTVQHLGPAVTRIDDAIKSTSEGVETTHKRILKLIDTSETIVQSTALLGGVSEDTPFITRVLELSAELATQLEAAVDSGRITMERLFDRTYRPIPGTDPEQFLTESTSLFDEILPPIQEPALSLDPKVIFCAAVDTNGYLPTHNRKFSQPQGDDPVWNTANARNRRIFDDRVGLKAGRNTEPFLLQVYRRDMGGGEFKMMKDLSAPINVKNRHWGGLRLAYEF